MQQEKDSNIKINKQVDLEFTAKDLTSWGGVSSMMAKYLDKLKFRGWVEENIPIEDTSNNTCGKYSKVMSLFLTVLTGGEKFSHISNWMYGEEIFKKCFNVKRFSKSGSSLTRFFNKIAKQSQSEQILIAARKITLIIINWLKTTSVILRFDSSVIVRYGKQEGARKGYNPNKKGRFSHNPLIAFIDSGLIVNLWNRPGNSSSGGGIIEFFENTLSSYDFKVQRIVADTGYYLVNFIEHIEGKAIKYIIGAPLCRIVQREILNIRRWAEVAYGIEVAEFYFRHYDIKWKKERRYVAVRQEVKKRPEATGKEISLFPDLPESKSYRYSVMITNEHELIPKEVWDGYKPRANDENVIKELKDSYGFAAFSLHSFWATETVMVLIGMVLFNLMVLMKKTVINPDGTSNNQMRTLRTKHFIIPGIMGRNSKKHIFRLGIKDKSKQLKVTQILRRIEFMPYCFYSNAVGFS